MASLLKYNEIFSSTRTLKHLLTSTSTRTQTATNGTQAARTYRFPTYEVTLMNHGECEDDPSKQFTGWQDSRLSPYGVEQAKRAGKIMGIDESHFHIAYTSELSRAQETVKHVLEPLLVQPKIFATWRLNDRHYGDLTGYNRSQMALVHGERKIKEWMDEYVSMPPIIKVENPVYKPIMENMSKRHLTPDQIPRAESLLMVYNRVLPYWENIIVPSLKMRNKVIIISHNDPLCAIIRHFAELTEVEVMSISLPPAIPFTFTLDNHMRIIKGKTMKATYVGAAKSQAQDKDQPPKGVYVPPQFEQQLIAQQQFRAQGEESPKPARPTLANTVP